MKKLLIANVLFLAACGAWAAEWQQKLETSVTAVTVWADDAGSWKISVRETPSAEKGVAVVEVLLQSPTPAVLPEMSVLFDLPQRDTAYWWHANAPLVNMPPNWAAHTSSRLSSSMPLYAYLSEDGENRLTVAADEVRREVKFNGGLKEEGSVLPVRLDFFTVREPPCRAASFRVRIDRRPAFYADAIREATDWIVASAGLALATVPESAFDPLYSSWYCFHQDLHAADVEAECAIAAKLGMKTLIVDDGWQTDDTNRGYAFCGDWQVSTNRFPDMAAHVRRVQAMGLKYMMWYSVPFVGMKSANYARFKGKYLCENVNGAAVLDPRFPDVREFLIGTYERALREWNLDGLKLDFIDSFGGEREAETGGGRDIETVPDAVDRLMRDVYARLKAIRPEVLIEFRQRYIGPGIRQFGNMLRVGDCPGDYLANRIGIAMLRLTSGDAAVHSDMLEWHPSERTEDAARFVLNSLFGTIQYSMMLRTLPPDHLKMIRHWLAFTQTHRETLLRGGFRPYRPDLNYPLIEATGRNERIFGVYAPDTVVRVPDDGRVAYVVNATAKGELVLDFAAPATVAFFDTLGRPTGRVGVPRKGLYRLAVPESGYARISR